MIKHHTTSENETEDFAAGLAKDCKPGDVLALRGGLGAGKTAFVRGLARGLGIDCAVSSPTFAIVHEYRGHSAVLYHFDMYRIESYDDLYSTGFFDYIGKGVLAVEWSENIENALSNERIEVRFEQGDGEDERLIEIATCRGAEKFE